MTTLEMARCEYQKRMEQLNELLSSLDSEEIKKLKEMGLITINTDKLPKERDILRESFNIASHGVSDSLFVYICDLVDYGKRYGFRQYTKVKVRNLEEKSNMEEPFNVSKYVGLLTGREKFVYRNIEDNFRCLNSVIQLPYDYKITEAKGLYPDGTWPLWKEWYEVEGFREQFEALQEYYYRRLLESSWNEVEDEIKNKEVLKKICLIK